MIFESSYMCEKSADPLGIVESFLHAFSLLACLFLETLFFLDFTLVKLIVLDFLCLVEYGPKNSP